MSVLRGRRIVVTRARDQAEGLVRSLEALGADVIAAPAIRIEPLPDDAALRSALADLSRWRWIVFTSQNAVHVVCDSMRGWGLQPAALATGNVVAVGPKTASALGREGVKVALVAEETTAEGVVAAPARRAPARCCRRGCGRRGRWSR